MKIGLLYNVNSFSEMFLFGGLMSAFSGLEVDAEGFTPFKKYTHLLVHESRYDYHRGAIERHKDLGQKIVVYTPNRDCPINETIVSSHSKTKHHFIEIGTGYRARLPKKKLSRVCWIGNEKEFSSYALEMSQTIDNSSLPFEIHSVAGGTFAAAPSSAAFKRFDEFTLDTDAIVISANGNDHVALECAVRGIHFLQLESKDPNNLLAEYAAGAPEHLKEFCREMKSQRDFVDIIELLQLTDGLFDPLIGYLRNKVLKHKLLTQRAVEYVELFNAL